MRSLFALFVLSVGLSSQTTWVVDAAGGGDFLNLVAANAAASDGDVVEVRAGVYPGSPTITKNMRIVGPAEGEARIEGTFGISSPTGITVSGIDAVRLHVFGCDGPVPIQDGEIAGVSSPNPGLCYTGRVSGSQDVRLERMRFIGPVNTSTCSGTALRIETSRVQLVGSFARGGRGNFDLLMPEDGAPAYDIRGASTVIFSGSHGRGGEKASLGGPVVPANAPCVWVDVDATAIVRGNSSTTLIGGQDPFLPTPGLEAPAVAGEGVLVRSGAVLDPPEIPESLTFSQPVPAQPFARLHGTLALGGTVGIDTFGFPGAVHAIAFSFDPATLDLPAKVDGPVGLDLSQAFLFGFRTLNGHNFEDTMSFTIPDLPEFENVRVVTQSFVEGLYPGTPYIALSPTSFVVASQP